MLTNFDITKVSAFPLNDRQQGSEHWQKYAFLVRADYVGFHDLSLNWGLFAHR